MLILSVHYKPSQQHLAKKCEHVVEFLLFSYKRLCTVAFGIRTVKRQEIGLRNRFFNVSNKMLLNGHLSISVT